MITYDKKPTTWVVKLDGKTVGEIRQVVGGYQYYPKGGKLKDAGEVYLTVLLCKKSLES